MESLLKLSGLLGDEDDDRTDLGTLEKRLTDKNLSQSNCGTPTRDPEHSAEHSESQPRTFDSPHHTPQMDKLPTPQKSNFASPKEVPKDRDQPVEELSDMMCSLVTNSCGETRYIGKIQGANHAFLTDVH